MIDLKNDYDAQLRQLSGQRKAPTRQVVLVGVLVVLAFMLAPEIASTFLISESAFDAYISGTESWAMLLALASFAIPLTVLIRQARVRAGLSLADMTGPFPDAVSSFWAVFKTVLIAAVVLELMPPWPGAGFFAEVRPIGGWLALLPIALLVLLIQVSAEELFFRGFLQRQLALRSHSPLIWMILPSAIFGALHYFNAQGPAEGVLWAFFATLLGIVSADLTARHGTLGPAIGLHLVNNIIAILIFGMQDGDNSGLALFLTSYSDPSQFAQGLEQLLHPWALWAILLQLLYVGILWLAARLAIRR